MPQTIVSLKPSQVDKDINEKYGTDSIEPMEAKALTVLRASGLATLGANITKVDINLTQAGNAVVVKFTVTHTSATIDTNNLKNALK